jgi:hypothetical protein
MLRITCNMAYRAPGVILAASLVVCAAGCREETEIRSYEVPRTETKKEPWHLLGAMIPRDTQVWFFKLDGPPERIDGLRDAFDQFVKSIRFTDKAEEPITWTLPERWQQEEGDKRFRYATIRIGAKDPLEMSVIPLPREREADSAFRNLLRWRDQLGLDPIPQSEVGQYTQKIDVAGVPVTKFDIKGYHVSRQPMFAAARGRPAPDRPAPAARPNTPLTYDVPAGWQEGQADGFRVATFKVKDGDQEAETTIIPLGKESGSVLANVNRWRGEVDLPPAKEAELGDLVRPITVDGIQGQYVDLAGPRLRTLAVMLTREDHTWFFKMRGARDLVGKQKGAFEAFVKSVKFKANPGN